MMMVGQCRPAASGQMVLRTTSAAPPPSHQRTAVASLDGAAMFVPHFEQVRFRRGFAEWEVVVEIARKQWVSIGMRMDNAAG